MGAIFGPNLEGKKQNVGVETKNKFVGLKKWGNTPDWAVFSKY